MKPTPIERDNLVEQLVAARMGAKVSARRVAFVARVSPAAIRHVENGHNRATARILRAYIATCKMDRDKADAVLLAWGIVPDDVLSRLQQEPQRLCAMVRGA
ncbi:hypothetical protein IAD21_00898 [Abditibacteriota bacterium]|nr:hypothetical protein IAD21_00898 [Abditibacteriota bacterium]